MFQKNQKYLISCHFFAAPDGIEYASVYGFAEFIELRDMLGFIPSGSTDQYAIKVSGENGTMIIAGDAVRSIIACDKTPEKVAPNSSLRVSDVARIYFI